MSEQTNDAEFENPSTDPLDGVTAPGDEEEVETAPAAETVDQSTPTEAAPAEAKPEEIAAAVADPEPKNEAKPVPEPPALEKPVVSPAPEPQPSAAQARLIEIEAIITREDFDPYTVEGRKLQLEHNRVAAKVAAEPLEQQLAAQHQRATVESTWAAEAERHGLPRKELETIWNGVLADYAKRHPNTDQSFFVIAAQEKYEAAIEKAKAAKTAVPVTTKAKPAPAPVTPKASAKVSPVGARAVTPTPRDEAEEFDKTYALGAMDFLS